MLKLFWWGADAPVPCTMRVITERGADDWSELTVQVDADACLAEASAQGWSVDRLRGAIAGAGRRK